MNREVQSLLKARNSAFRSGDKAQYSAARADLKRGIKAAKENYRRKIEDHLQQNNPRQVWQGLQHLTNYKSRPPVAVGGNAELAEELNRFFARFETTTPHPVTLPPPSTTLHTLTLQEHQVRCVLMAVNPNKAAGPDGVLGKVLKACADQLSGVFTKIFNISLTQASIPTCLQSATIVPVPKKPIVSNLNDCRPVALTSVVMKCFEKLIAENIKASLPHSFDPHQFAYRANRSTADAINTALYTTLSHLELPGTYVRMLFIDYSSAFNTIIPGTLVDKLLHLGFPLSTCTWILNFLTNRPQTVRIGSHSSSTITISTGSPQGCVLSPLLYSLYTYDCAPIHSSNTIIKFADDTTVVGLITGGDESKYREEVQSLSKWCSNNNLELNTKKTKEMVIDFRRKRNVLVPLQINGDEVERVSTFKFLGTTISKDLSWTDDTMAIVKKSQQRLRFLRLLRKTNLQGNLLVTFYRSAIESVLAYCLTVWYSGCSAANRKALQRIIKTAEKIIGCPLPSLEDIANSRCLHRACNIIKDNTHPGHELFSLLPSGR